MGEYWESATEEIRERLEDPLLKVEVEFTYKKNPETGIWEHKRRYEILKWFREYDNLKIVIGGELVVLVYDAGYWAHQKYYGAWDGRVEKDMIASRLKGRLKEIKQKELEEIERTKREMDENAGALGRELGRDLYRQWHPKIFSTPS